MRRSIFYSWQSDLPNATNRGFIEGALNRALKSIKKDDTVDIVPVLDRDTQGVPGSPSITDSILTKIVFSNVFVADVSIINKSQGGRPTPNPNVLFEIGYAVAHLGWDRIILVQNTEFGTPEDLPFDLRGRRIVTYRLSEEQTDKAAQRGPLQVILEDALRSALEVSDENTITTDSNAPIWWGKWSFSKKMAAQGGSLFIYDVGPSGFLFSLDTFNGSHTGNMRSYAKLISPNFAVSRIHNHHRNNTCEISFRRIMKDGELIIETSEGGDCFLYHGMGASFDGSFTRDYDLLFSSGFLNELDLRRLYSITGQYYDDLLTCIQSYSEQEIKDHFVAKAISGAPRGLFTIMEGIIMRGESGELWAAYIDGDHVRYFTTQEEYKDKLPNTFEEWRSRFNDKKVIYHTTVETIPPSL
ncbi:TIR domain-containing protein [Azospirillum argentinense]